jgi:hypothetical protein
MKGIAVHMPFIRRSQYFNQTKSLRRIAENADDPAAAGNGPGDLL